MVRQARFWVFCTAVLVGIAIVGLLPGGRGAEPAAASPALT